jgi:hypothetical protein
VLLVQPTDDEDEDEYYDDSDCGSDDEYDWDMPAVRVTIIIPTLLLSERPAATDFFILIIDPCRRNV